MSRRVLKQFIYGLFYLAVFAAIGGSVYLVYLKPAPTCEDGNRNQGEEETDCGGPCTPCEIKKLQPLKVLPPQLFDAGNGKTTIVFRVQNPNLNYAASRFLYEINLFDRGNNRILFIADESFVYAGAEKTIIVPAADAAFSAIKGSDVKAYSPKWIKKADFSKAELATREIKVERSGIGVTVTGVVQNKESYGLSEAVVGVVVAEITDRGVVQPLNASKTALATLAPFEERFFSVFVPLTKEELAMLDSARTSIMVDARR